MKKETRRTLAIIALAFMIPFVVCLGLSLAQIPALGHWPIALAGVFGCAALIVFLLIKMDDASAAKKKDETEQRLREGAEAFEAELARGEAVEVADGDDGTECEDMRAERGEKDG